MQKWLSVLLGLSVWGIYCDRRSLDENIILHLGMRIFRNRS